MSYTHYSPSSHLKDASSKKSTNYRIALAIAQAAAQGGNDNPAAVFESMYMSLKKADEVEQGNAESPE